MLGLLRGRRRVPSAAFLSACVLVPWSGCTDDELDRSNPSCVGFACAPAPGSDSGALPNQPGNGGDAGPSGGAILPSGPTGLPCDVEEIVYRHCSSCHSDPPVGTYMPLLTHADFHAQGTTDNTKKYFELASGRINSADDPMPPRDKPQLTEQERSVLDGWFAQGAPQQTGSCGTTLPDAGTPPPDGREVDTTGLECYRFLAHAPDDKNQKFKVGTATDAYFNFIFDAPWQGTAYGIVIKPIVDNGPVLHHWLLYHEPGAGFDGEIQDSGGQHSGGEMVHGWAPGGPALDTRPYGDVAFELPDSTYLVEFHYNSADPSAEDASGVEICVKHEQPEHLAGLSWLGYDNGAESYAAGAILGTWASGNCLTPSTEWEGTCRPSSDEPIHMMLAIPHMHQAGRHMKAVINGPNGSRVIHDKAFDFSSQVGYELNEVLMPGETITTTCQFSEPKCAGQATSAEMCYFFTYAYPKGALRDNGNWGRIAHGDNTCLGQ